MKLNTNPWPWAIILTFAIFISGTVGLVVMACTQKADLVSTRYYEQELKFQHQLEQLERTSRLGAQAAVAYDAGKQNLTVTVPSTQLGKGFKGDIELYRPSEAGLDSRFDLKPDAQGRQTLETASLRKGLWRVRVSWTSAEHEYLLEQKVVIE